MATNRTQQAATFVKGVQENVWQRNADALRRRTAAAPDIETARNAHNPSAIAFVLLGVIAVVFDVVDVFGPPIDATVLGFVVLVIFNLAFFFCIKAFLNRGGTLLGWFLMGCLALAMLAAPTIIFTPFAIILLVPVIVAGALNNNQVVVEESAGNIVGHLQQLEGAVAGYRRRTAQLIRAGRRIPALRSVTARAVRGARTLTKTSKITQRALRRTVLNVIPFLGIINLQIWNVYATYRDQKRLYAEAQELIAEYEARVQEEQMLIRALNAEAEAGSLIQIAQSLSASSSVSTPTPEPESVRRPTVVRDIGFPAAVPAGA